MESKAALSRMYFPGLNTSLDSFGQLSGKLSGVLSGVDPLVDQTKGILDNLNTSLNDSKTALESTGNALQKVQEKLNSVTADLNALRSSQSYQDFLNLTGLDSEAVSEFMVCTGSSENRVLLSGEKLWKRQ